MLISLYAYDSVEILAFAFVTFTPSCFARATICIRFLDETACAILQGLVSQCNKATFGDINLLLGRVCLVVHEEQVEVASVVDEEGLVARWHHVTGLLVVSEADLRTSSHQYVHLYITYLGHHFHSCRVCIFSPNAFVPLL